jgi:hypothetical protein
MAMVRKTYGKDHPAQSNESFIGKALTGGTGDSNEVVTYPVDRPEQKIKTSFAMDNVVLACPIKTSLKDMTWPGGVDNIKHSLTGASAVNEEVGAAGKVKHVIVPNH